MNKLQIGDRVQWTHTPAKGKDKTPRPMSGSVLSIHSSRKPWAAVQSDGQGKWGGHWVVPLSDLVVIDDAPAPIDEHANLLALHPEPWRVIESLAEITDDYALLMNAGDLGGVELRRSEAMNL